MKGRKSGAFSLSKSSPILLPESDDLKGIALTSTSGGLPIVNDGSESGEGGDLKKKESGKTFIMFLLLIFC